MAVVEHWGHNPPLAHPRNMVGEVPSKGGGDRESGCPYAGIMPIQMLGRYSNDPVDSVNRTISSIISAINSGGDGLPVTGLTFPPRLLMETS